MERLRLSHVALGVPDVERACHFYTDVVGLTPSERLDDGRVRLGWGRGHHALELANGDGLLHMALEVEAATLDRLLERLAAAGVQGFWTKAESDHPAAYEFLDPDGNRVQLHGRVDRSGERRAGPGSRPIRIHHVTLTSANLGRLVDFYVDVLGLKVSDQMGDVFTWLRSDAEHHTIAIVSGEHCGLDHYAFEIEDWEDIKRWCDQLAMHDVALTWGPGRHGPGNNLFVMFDDLAGYRIELSCEMERFWDSRAHYADEPRHWQVDPRTVNLWGPSPDWRNRRMPTGVEDS